jgi:DNA polymerase-3 subunit delta
MPATPQASRAPLALIHGEDDFAVTRRARQLYQEWCAEAGGMDHETLDAQVSNSGEALRVLARLREALQTLPFFGGGKVIWLQNCSFLGDDRAASAQALTESLAELAHELKAFAWDNVRLLISAGKVDKRKTFYKTLEKLGTVECHEALSVEDRDWADKAELWATQALRARGKSIDDEALAELVNQVGPNHRQLESEVEKLSLYAGDRARLGVDDVRALVPRHKQARAFALGDALGERNLPLVLRRLDEELWQMRTDKDKSEIGLLYGLITKVRAMLLAKEMIREGWLRAGSDFTRFKAQLAQVPANQFPEDRKFNPLALNPYVLFRAAGHAQNYTLDELARAMRLLLDCNQRLILSGLDEALVLQQTLVQIVQRDGPVAIRGPRVSPAAPA